MKETTLFQMKRSASAAVKKAFHELIDTIPLPINTAIDSIIFFFVDEDVNRSWVYHLNKQKEKGEMYLSTKERREFILDLSAQAQKKFTFEVDPASRLLLMGATNIADTISWHMKFPDCLLSNFKLEGTYGCIDGVPRSGKTSLAVSFIEILGKKGFKIITNISIRNKPDYITYVQKLSNLVITMDETKTQWVCILDETATIAYKKRAVSTANVDFENLARFIGKMNGRLIMISHSFEMDIPTILQTWITERYTKKTLESIMVHLEREGGFMKMRKLITGVPDAELEYVTEDITSLQFDISIKQLLERVQDNISISDAVKEQTEKKEQKEEVTTRAHIVTAIHTYPNMTNYELSEHCDTSVNYVKQVKRESRRNGGR